PDLDVVAAREVELGVVQPPGHVDVGAADAVLVVRHLVDEAGDEPGHVHADRVGEVLSDRSAGVGEALGEEAGPGVEQETRRLACARREHDDARGNVLVLARGLVDVVHARDATVLPDGDLTGHRLGDQRQPSRLQRGANQDPRAGEIGVGPAPAVALSAVVTGGAAVMRPRDDRQARRNAGDIEPVGCLLHQLLVAAGLRRREEDTVRVVAKPLDAPEDADQPADPVVVGGQVVIANRPVLPEPVDRLAAEVVGTEAKGDAAPGVGAPAPHASAPPAEAGPGRPRVRLALDLPSPVAGVELAKLSFAGRCPAPRGLVGPLEHFGVPLGEPLPTGFQHEDPGTRGGQRVRSHTAAGPGSHDDHVVRVLRGSDRHRTGGGWDGGWTGCLLTVAAAAYADRRAGRGLEPRWVILRDAQTRSGLLHGNWTRRIRVRQR